ncbi:titin homolog isoform X2 [Orussus abietinus]|uniref:titin homolog isoform X2 n=1 Tax=Orussus abietinus TaxID=222816 RepID=UPI0006266428|nr:titin homolog isoform X2 [Orussus abietinus]XP_023288596.1 titin homolog isoform X2 [Orussus abietinus]
MASREKRPLAPSKSKQKANNDSGLPSTDTRSKKSEELLTLRHLRFLEAVSTGNSLSSKVEANLPRSKKVLKNLKRKQKLRAAKANLIKVKVTKAVPIKTLKRIGADVKKGVKARRVKKSEETNARLAETSAKVPDSNTDSADCEGITKTTKNNLRVKKTKYTTRGIEESETGDPQDKDLDASSGANSKTSPKSTKKVRLLGKKSRNIETESTVANKSAESVEVNLKNGKTSKVTPIRRNISREREANPKINELEVKVSKNKRSIIKEFDGTGSKSPKLGADKCSIDLTIDEVIASMLSDSEAEIEGKLTRSRKMLIGEKLLTENEIKKEADTEEEKTASDEEATELDLNCKAIQPRKRIGNALPQRSLRNGKLRQLSDSGISSESDVKRRRRLNSDGADVSENCLDDPVEVSTEGECFFDLTANDSQDTANAESDPSMKSDGSKSFEEVIEIDSEIENNNNSERLDRSGELGPTLRSKTKVKNTEPDAKLDDAKMEEAPRSPQKTIEVQEDTKKPVICEPRKEIVLAKLGEKPKSRRGSLNLDVKKAVGPFYGAEKTEGGKSQIDQMIENIKLTIAKSIESQIFSQDKGLGLGKKFEVPKIEEIVAPLSADSQKLGLEESAEEGKANASKSEPKSETPENTVPKVAATAKEIEKLVMGDMKLVVDAHPQKTLKTQENDPAKVGTASDSRGVFKENPSTKGKADSVEEPADEGTSVAGQNVVDSPKAISDTSESSDQPGDRKTPEDGKKAATRKSLRIIDKVSDGSPESDGIRKKSPRTSDKTGLKATDLKAVLSSENESTPGAEEGATTCESREFKEVREEQTPKVEETTAKESSESMKGLSFPGDVDNVPRILEEDPTVGGRVSASELKVGDDENASITTRSEDTETLESISREVERLVAEGPSGKDATEDEVEELPNVTLEAPEGGSLQEFREQVEEEDSVDVTPKSGTPMVISGDSTPMTSTTSTTSLEIDEVEHEEKSPRDDPEVLPESDSSDSGKNACHSLTVDGCDLNSECAVKSVPKDSFSPKETRELDNSESKDCEEDPEEGRKVASSEADKQASKDEELDVKLETEKSGDEKTSEEQKATIEENRRVLRARERTAEKQRKIETRLQSRNAESSDSKIKDNDPIRAGEDAEENQGSSSEERTTPEGMSNRKDEDDQALKTEDDASLEPQTRTRRSRETKKRKDDQQVQHSLKPKRSRRDNRRSDQQNKEETLLDNEVAKINENDRSLVNHKFGKSAEGVENFRGFSASDKSENTKPQQDTLRSKSENDLACVKADSDAPRRNLQDQMEAHSSKKEDQPSPMETASNGECKTTKTPETSQKDSDEASTSGESSRSATLTPKFLETPEDKAKKESILRLLGLESLEKAAERMNHQKAKKEQYTGTLKTVIRVQKEKERDKKRSRSPLKMVLKQGRGDGEGDSPDFYTIQKEFGTSGLGDSSSGANRKFTTNHRHSCDEDNEEAAPKDRQSLVIPEKSSSFSIHPGRLCADVCCYCFGKFGSLDTPMHLAQMKSDERRKKILNVERHLTKDSCLCDACYRHVDRKAHSSPTNMQTKPQRQHRQLMVSKCTARECREPARHHVKRRWLLKIKAGLHNQVDIDWESSQHTSLSFCVNHYSKIERFLTCALCKRRLARNHTHQLVPTETGELNQRLRQQGIPVLLSAGTFVCKLCRYFTQLQLKYKDVDNMNTNHRSFFKSYRKRILHYHDIEVLENEEEDAAQSQVAKEKRKKAKCQGQSQGKSGISKSPDVAVNSTSEKSTPEPNKNEGTNSETDNENRTAKMSAMEDGMATDEDILSLQTSVDQLKKFHRYSSGVSSEETNEVVEILAMDKEVTLTRLPKRPRPGSDINPVVQRLGANPSISVRTLFPGEEEMNLHANIDFNNVREITPQGWEKCATMIQYDRDTKLLWQELQRPYGNQSSFLRHLILLEKYYRSGDLVLAPNASRNAINYSTSVHNRLISYEGPEKMDEPILEPISEFNNSRRLSGGYVLERDRLSLPSTSSLVLPSSSPTATNASHSSKAGPNVVKLTPGVSIIKKPPPNLQRLGSLPSTSATNGALKRKEGPKVTVSSGGKIFQLSEPDFKRLQSLKRQKLMGEKQVAGTSSSPPGLRSVTQYQKAQLAAQTQFQKHLRMQQEMLNRQSRSDFEPLICDVRTLASDNNAPSQSLLNNLNLPKSIQVTTKPPANPIPILPKIPKSLTVIPQTVSRPADK